MVKLKSVRRPEALPSGTAFPETFMDVAVPVIFMIGVLILMPLRDQFEFDADEGLNVMKAVLVGEGYALYRDIWNDQPPLFTLILAAGFKLFGQSILLARFLVLTFGSLLVFSFHRLLRVSVGPVPAIAATILLISSYEFIRLNASVMIGIPALALALLSMVLLDQYQRVYHPKHDEPQHEQIREFKQRQYVGGDRPQTGIFWLYGSGLCFACSLHMKLFTIVLIPLICIQLLHPHLEPHLIGNHSFSPYKIRLNQGIRDIIIWLLWVWGPFLVIALGFNYVQLDQVLTPHLQSRQGIDEFEQRSLSLAHLIDQTLEQNWVTYGLAGMGIIVAWVGKHRRAIIPGLWLLIVVLVLIDHQPVWYHYGPLLMVPLCWLAAYGMIPLGQVLKRVFLKPIPKDRSTQSGCWTQRIAFWTAGLVGVLSIFAVGAEAKGAIASLERYADAGQPSERTALVQTIQRYGDETNWLFTDAPLYGFYAGVTIPPDIVVFSKKRVLTGQLSEETVLNLMQTYNPEQILFSRFVNELTRQRSIARYIRQHYRRVTVSDDLNVDYFVKKSLL